MKKSFYKQIGTNRYREDQGLFYEEFNVGDIFEHRPGRTITDNDNIWFTLLTMNTAQGHFDQNYAAYTEWKKLLVDSTLTLAIVTGMSVKTLTGKGVANLGWDKVKLSHPVFAGDTLYAESEIIDKRESKSRPTQGIVIVRTKGFNQNHQETISFERTFLVYKKGASPKDDLY
ncbi:MAG: MaoC/PaaZ C-terminal domain-containing protein [Hyphomicrobiales bacterium]